MATPQQAHATPRALTVEILVPNCTTSKAITAGRLNAFKTACVTTLTRPLTASFLGSLGQQGQCVAPACLCAFVLKIQNGAFGDY